MTEMTITEALAEIKTLGKRINQKVQFITNNAGRPSVVLDPLEKDGGSEKRVREEVQAHGDLVSRIEWIRVRIQEANQKNTITLEGITKSVAGWLAWRKECAPLSKSLLQSMAQTLKSGREQLRNKTTEAGPVSLVAHYSEDEIAKSLETIEKILGSLDGKLSLFNATSKVDVP